MMPRLFVDQAISVGAQISLDEHTIHRLHKVLRAKVGDALTLFNGQGGEYAVELTHLTRKEAIATVIGFDPIERESPLDVQLIQGISRGNRMDYTIQKSVELGVKGIIPVTTKRSMVKLDGDRKDNRHEHWRGVITHACEQSGRTRIPALAEVMPLTDIAMLADIRQAFFLDTKSSLSLQNVQRPAGPCYIIAGPEGGFDESERDLIRNLGIAAVKFGPRILRTETAALAALSVMQSLWGDLNLP